MPWISAAAWSSDALAVPVTLMLTTAGPSREVMVEKSGSVTMAAGATLVALVVGAFTARALVYAPAPTAPITPAVAKASTRAWGEVSRVFISSFPFNASARKHDERNVGPLA